MNIIENLRALRAKAHPENASGFNDDLAWVDAITKAWDEGLLQLLEDARDWIQDSEWEFDRNGHEVCRACGQVQFGKEPIRHSFNCEWAALLARFEEVRS